MSASNITRTATLFTEVPHERRELLDLVDKLREQGVDALVPLPQLVVCGSQSAGKSSVLEAISNIPFPVKSNTCTRFAIEVVLRHHDDTSKAMTATIRITPDKETSGERRIRLEEFQHGKVPMEKISDYIADATDEICNEAEHSFSKDKLHIEVSGPNLPHLTLVDLPGLIADTSEDAQVGDDKKIEDLVRGYLEHPSSIVLAVLNGKLDPNLQKIQSIVRECGCNKRTLGVITQLDRLEEGDGLKTQYMRFAMNEANLRLGLGWHVVRNPGPNERTLSSSERENLEAQFLSDQKQPWSQLPESCRGLPALVKKLTKRLDERIGQDMPVVLAEMKKLLIRSKSGLDSWGQPRDNKDKQITFLIKKAVAIQALIQAGVEGNYGANNRCWPVNIRRLRARFASACRDFVQGFEISGYSYNLTRSGGDGIGQAKSQTQEWHSFLQNNAEGRQSSIRELYKPFPPESKEFAKFVTEIENTVLRNGRGIEILDNYNPKLLKDLFVMISSRWESLAKNFAEELCTETYAFLQEVLEDQLDTRTLESLEVEVVEPFWQTQKRQLMEKVDEVLRPYTELHPATWQPRLKQASDSLYKQGYSLLINTQDAVPERSTSTKKDKTGDDTHTTSIGAGGNKAESKVVELPSSTLTALKLVCEAYAVFDTVKYTFLDNLFILAIENCLLQPLQGVFTPELVSVMTDDVLHTLASESEDVVRRRRYLTERVKELEAALKLCDKYKLLAARSQPERQPVYSTSATSEPFACPKQAKAQDMLASADGSIDFETTRQVPAVTIASPKSPPSSGLPIGAVTPQTGRRRSRRDIASPVQSPALTPDCDIIPRRHDMSTPATPQTMSRGQDQFIFGESTTPISGKSRDSSNHFRMPSDETGVFEWVVDGNK